MNTEIHLFLIWERGQSKKQLILNDINKHFQIIHIENISWDEDNFPQNIGRFYDKKLPPGSGKVRECGMGIFTLIVVNDPSPIYEKRQTSRGTEIVNIKMFDAKSLYREWTNGGHKIHATNNPAETRKDLILLTGKTYEIYEKITQYLSPPFAEDAVERNLHGCIQWRSLKELFSTLNETIEYTVLRNFDGLPENYYTEHHNDIDLLVRNREQAAYVINAIPVFMEKYRVHYKVNINYQTVRFDIRSVGDGYYDEKWQDNILTNRVANEGFFIPNQTDYKFSLLYHALIHKKSIADDYMEKLMELGYSKESYFKDLKCFMQSQNYHFSEPTDYSVFFNAKLIGCSVSNKRKLEKKLKKFHHFLNRCGRKKNRK